MDWFLHDIDLCRERVNELPKSVRCYPTVNSFKHEAKKYYMDEALARTLSM